MSPEKKLRFAVIGCGGISRFHVNGLVKAGAEIACVVDVKPEAAEQYVQRHGARYTDDYREAIEDASVDAVTVTTPSRLHFAPALAALKAGKPVIVEKTLTDNVNNSLKLVQTVKDTGTLCFTAYMKRFFPAMQKAKELVPSLGQLISIHARSWQPWGDIWTRPLTENDSAPSFFRRNYGGGMLVMGGSHILDLTMWLVGRPARLWANQFSREGMDVDLRHTALMTLPDGGQAAGASVCFEACGHPHRIIGYQKNGWEERIEINGLNGRLEIYPVWWDRPEQAPALLIHTDEKCGQVHEYRFPAVNSFDLEMAHFADCIRKGKQGSPDVHDGYAVDEVIAHITKSAKTSKPLDVKFRD